MGNPIKKTPSTKKHCIIPKFVNILVSCVNHVFARCVVNVSSTQHGLLCKVGADEYWWSSGSGTGLKAIIILYWNIKYLPFWQHRSYLHDKFCSLPQTAVEKTIDVIHAFKNFNNYACFIHSFYNTICFHFAFTTFIVASSFF